MYRTAKISNLKSTNLKPQPKIEHADIPPPLPLANIPFTKPFLTGKELSYIQEAVRTGKLSGDGYFTKKCHTFFEKRYGFKKVLLTHSCTAALELSALLMNIQPGDEVIMPSFTFVSTANAFALRGASIRFADCQSDLPNIDPAAIEKLITKKTKAIVVVHYAGLACDMEAIMDLANQYQLFVVEDAAHAIDAYYKDQPLGSIGHFGCFSFHDTKNITAGGEGGLLSINDPAFIQRAEIMREKGTNRAAFYRGEVNKYEWVDIGSSFLPSETTAAFLYAQLKALDDIQEKRKYIWNTYYELLRPLVGADTFQIPIVPEFAASNGHLFYLLCTSKQSRQKLIDYLKAQHICAVFHYISLHSSPYFKDKHDGRDLPMTDQYSDRLLRLPLFYEMNKADILRVVEEIKRGLTIIG